MSADEVDGDRPMTLDEINRAIGELVERGLVRHRRDPETGELLLRNGHAVWEAVPPDEIETR